MDPFEFDNISSAAIYVAFIAAVSVGMTWIEATHSLLRGLIAGGAGIAILLIVRWVVRRDMS